MNGKQIWEETVKRLEKVYERREAENIAFILLEDVFAISRSNVLAALSVQINEGDFEECIERLERREPIQYVTGLVHFYGRQFLISPGVLIPRPETEELVNVILKENELVKPKILDIGVGSGCIAISLGLGFGVRVHGVEVSPEALAIATRNAKHLNANVDFTLLNVLNEPLSGVFDIIVSNPPYIPNSDKKVMHDNVLEYEPATALFVPDDQPLIFYSVIAKRALNNLKKGGMLYFEIHENYGKEIKVMLESFGYSSVHIYQDMQGKDRMIKASLI